jgi:hypothetical protein
LNIPQNKVVFYDFLYKNVKLNYDGVEKITNFAAQYEVNRRRTVFTYAWNLEILRYGFQYDAKEAV